MNNEFLAAGGFVLSPGVRNWMDNMLAAWSRLVVGRYNGGTGYRVANYSSTGGGGVPVLPHGVLLDDMDWLCRVVPAMPERIRAVLEAHYLQPGWSVSLLVATLKISRATYYRRLDQALAWLGARHKKSLTAVRHF